MQFTHKNNERQRECLRKIAEALDMKDLPLTGITLRMGINQATTVVIERFVTIEELEKIAGIVSEVRLDQIVERM